MNYGGNPFGEFSKLDHTHRPLQGGKKKKKIKHTNGGGERVSEEMEKSRIDSLQRSKFLCKRGANERKNSNQENIGQTAEANWSRRGKKMGNPDESSHERKKDKCSNCQDGDGKNY